MTDRYLECPDSAPPITSSLTSRIDIDAVEAQWQRTAERGEFLNPGEPGYQEAQQQLTDRRADFIRRFGLPAVEVV